MKKLLRLFLMASIVMTVVPQEFEDEDVDTEQYDESQGDMGSDEGEVESEGDGDSSYTDDSGADDSESNYDDTDESGAETDKTPPEPATPPQWIEEDVSAQGFDSGLESSGDIQEEFVEESPAEGETEEVVDFEDDVKSDDEDIMGIDTTDLDEPQGNWLYKRLWWEKAEAKYEKIRATVTKLFESRANFFTKRTELDKNTLDPFYIKIGMQQGELQTMLTGLIDLLKAQEERAETQGVSPDGDDDEETQEADSLERVQKKRVALESLSQEVDNVIKAEVAVDEAIVKLVEQMNRLRNYEQQAWQDFKDLARVLNDKKARELYYKVDGAWRNIKDIQQYIEQTYTESFDKLVEQVNSQVGQVQLEMDSLQQMGVDLKKEIIQELSENRDEVSDDELDEQEQEAPSMIRRFIINPLSSLVSGIGSIFGTAWNKVISLVSWPFTRTAVDASEDDGVEEIIDNEEQVDFDDQVEADSGETDQDNSDEQVLDKEEIEPVDLAQEIARDDQSQQPAEMPAEQLDDMQDEVMDEALNQDDVVVQEEVAIQE